MGKIFSGGRECFPPTRVDLHSLPVRETRSSRMDLSLYESVLKDGSLPRVPKHVLLYLVFRSDRTDTCFASQKTIARELGYPRQQISRAITWLRTHKRIKTLPRGRIFSYDLSPSRTSPRTEPVHQSDKYLSASRTDTCPPVGHRTKPLTSNGTIPPSAAHIAAIEKRIRDAEKGAKQRFIDGYVENQKKKLRTA